jgi:hypothetical protein
MGGSGRSGGRFSSGQVDWDRCYDFLNTFAKKSAFLTQNKANLCKKNYLSIGFFEKNVNFFAENCRKSQKTSITSTPGQVSI